MALSLLTPWLSSAPLDPAKARARFRGGAYTDAQVDQFLASLHHHAETTGMATAALAAQVAKETGSFRFGGQVKPEQFNFAGVGSTNDGAAGHSFGSINAGVMGLISHHGSYIFGPLDRWPPAWEPYKPFAIRNAQVLALVIDGEHVAGTVRTIGHMRNGVWAWTKNIPLGSLNNGYAKGIVDIGNTLLGGAPVALQKPTVDASHPSPNRNGYAGKRRVDAVTWHITEGTNSLGWLTSPASGASSNYLIARVGTIYELVPPTEDAWANGDAQKPNLANPLVAKWKAEGVNFNQRTISLEHEGFTSKGTGGSLTAAQIKATVALTAWLCDHFGIAPDRTHIMPHAWINSVTRPNCPGFSSLEFDTWVGKIAALVNGSTPPPPVSDPGFPGIIQGDGRSVVNGVDFGGEAVTAEAVELTVKNAQGEHYSRKWEGHTLGDWRKVG